MGMSGGDAGQPTSVAIAGMGIAGGCSLLILASVTVCLANWGVEIARVGVVHIHRIECRGNWMHNSQPLRYQGVSCASACPVDRFSFACGVDGRVDARVPLAPPSQAGF